MKYFNIATQTPGYLIDDVRAANPHMSIPDDTADLPDDTGFTAYVEVAPPVANADQIVVEAIPINGAQAWTVQTLTGDALVAALVSLQGSLVASLNATRDNLIIGGFPFSANAVTYTIQSRSQDQENVLGLYNMAKEAIAAGAEPGNLRWFDPDVDFTFITANNALLPVDAQGMIALFQAGVSYKASLTFKAFDGKAAINAANTVTDAQAAFNAVVLP